MLSLVMTRSLTRFYKRYKDVETDISLNDSPNIWRHTLHQSGTGMWLELATRWRQVLPDTWDVTVNTPMGVPLPQMPDVSRGLLTIAGHRPLMLMLEFSEEGLKYRHSDLMTKIGSTCCSYQAGRIVTLPWTLKSLAVFPRAQRAAAS